MMIRPSHLVFLFLSWSYLIEPNYLQSVLPAFLYGPLAAALVLAAIYFFQSDNDEIYFNSKDALTFAAYAALLAGLNFFRLDEALTGDEIYHMERSTPFWFAQHAGHFIECMADKPVALVNSYLNVAVLVLAGAALSSAALLKERLAREVRYAAGFVALATLGTLFALLKIAPESHPPLRLLPPFLTQLIFGLEDFAFRLPGVLMVALVALMTAKLVLFRRPGDVFSARLAGAAVLFIPTVFHSATLLEPSIWAFSFGVLGIYAFAFAHYKNSGKYLVWGAVLFGAGVLFRQNTVVFWAPAFLFLVFKRKLIERPLLVVLPFIFTLPYFWGIMHIGHPVVNVKVLPNPSVIARTVQDRTNPSHEVASVERQPRNENAMNKKITTPLRNIRASLASGEGPALLLKSSDVIWVALMLLAMMALLLLRPEPIEVFFLVFLGGYALFHSLFPGLWGVGRYQAEYVAPCTALVIFLLAANGALRSPGMVALLVALCAHSLFFNLTARHDIAFENKFRKRLTTEFTMPYKEALGAMNDRGGSGNFVVLGGAPISGEGILWPRGFSKRESALFWELNGEFQRRLSSGLASTDFLAFLSERRVDFFLVQYGERRDLLNRTPELQALIKELETSSGDFMKQQTFFSRSGGLIDIYARKGTLY